MAKNGFKLIDAEMHVMEPVDLWQRYIGPEFATRAPRRLDERYPPQVRTRLAPGGSRIRTLGPGYGEVDLRHGAGFGEQIDPRPDDPAATGAESQNSQP